MKNFFLFIATMFAMTACFSDKMATIDSVSVANVGTIVTSNKELKQQYIARWTWRIDLMKQRHRCVYP